MIEVAVTRFLDGELESRPQFFSRDRARVEPGDEFKSPAVRKEKPKAVSHPFRRQFEVMADSPRNTVPSVQADATDPESLKEKQNGGDSEKIEKKEVKGCAECSPANRRTRRVGSRL